MRTGLGAEMAYLQRRNPTIKLAAVIAAALPLTFVFDPVTPLVMFVAILAVGRILGGLSLRAQLRPLAVFVLAGIAILLANIFFNKQNATSPLVFSIGAVDITRAALWAAASLWLRLLCFALLSLVFVRTTEPQHLLLSLVHQLHLSDRVAYGIMVGYRMLPVFQADYVTIRAAQRLRGVREGSALLHPFSRIRRYALPLLAGAVRRAGRIAIAMDARAFGALPRRTYRERMLVVGADWVFLALAVVVVAGIVTGTWLSGIGRFTVS
jgi:energy-coupling factor transport system permease protein